MVAETLLADVLEEGLVAVTSEVGNCACSHMAQLWHSVIALRLLCVEKMYSGQLSLSANRALCLTWFPSVMSGSLRGAPR